MPNKAYKEQPIFNPFKKEEENRKVSFAPIKTILDFTIFGFDKIIGEDSIVTILTFDNLSFFKDLDVIQPTTKVLDFTNINVYQQVGKPLTTTQTILTFTNVEL